MHDYENLSMETSKELDNQFLKTQKECCQSYSNHITIKGVYVDCSICGTDLTAGFIKFLETVSL